MARWIFPLAALVGGLSGLLPRGASAEIPSNWDVATGDNVKWVVELGSYSYGGPVVADGRIFVGTNNESPRDPSVVGDRGVLMAFREEDGSFLWQATHEKLALELDYPEQGVCSTPRVEGDRLYYVSNRGELVCLDTEGFRDGENDGPFDDEARVDETSADVVWRFDFRQVLEVVPHYMSASTPVLDGDLVFALTSNGVDEAGHVPAPVAPSFIAVDKSSGTLIWADSSPRDLIDGQWSSPVVLHRDGRSQVLFGGGDGRLYAFEPQTGLALWSFDGNAAARLDGRNPRDFNAFVATPVVAGDRVFIGMGRDPEVGSAAGSLWALESSHRGELDEEAIVWKLGGEDFGRTIATVTIDGDLLYATDLNGFVVALNASTGAVHWRYDAFAPIWASPALIDGRLFVADTDGDVAVFESGPQMRLLAENEMGSPVYRRPVASNGTLFVMTTDRLFALATTPGPPPR